MKLRLRVSKVGGKRLGIYLPNEMVEQMDLRVGDVVELDEKGIQLHRWGKKD